ncbi:hypothetical protein [Devosia sp. RR2S18]|uniref:hypothetical protein n=1 Tax=Devosia rhizosphaerae TaxID=3049774 RepID=UPI00253FCB55|nr:hypothetical protein [Devosia sp. RR2S18]WIJ24636.1 hypothetical protein QOV41_16700 [Devosia sp. RR2S18]
MRFLVLAFFAMFCIPALAQFWDHYANARFGYSIDVPPGYSGTGESANGDGQSFEDPGRMQTLLVWGGQLHDGLDAEVANAMRSAAETGWAITYQVATPEWAAFSASKDQRLQQQRLIRLCDGASYAAFRIEYAQEDVPNMESTVAGLVRSLRPEGC